MPHPHRPSLAASRLHLRLLWTLVCTLPLTAVRADSWRPGDHVEVWNSDWYPAEVVTVGDGEHSGQYYIHYTGKSGGGSEQWILARNLRTPRSKTPSADALARGPRLGKYRTYSYGAPPNRVYLGDLELLADGHYRATRPGGAALGEGKYAYDAAAHAVKWLSGPYHGTEWTGIFEITREGKTHSLRLTRNTVASNSTDAP